MNTPINKSIFNETGCIRKEQLLRYRDHRLSGKEQHEVEEHLVDCVLCSDALEGLVLVSGSASLDSLSREVAKVVSASPVNAFRPWLAAATLTGVILLSYFTYIQYKHMGEQRLAVHETQLPVVESPVNAPPPGSVNVDGTPDNSANIQEKQIIPEAAFKTKDESHSAKIIEKSLPEESAYAVSEDAAEITTEGASAAEMEIPVVASKDIASFSTALKNDGNQNITYVDNVKIIDYNEYESDNIKQADVPRSTSSKYQNNKKKTEAAESEQKSGIVVKRKADYLELVADPVILFNNGRFESANSGFDELLKLNSKDQNAAFYKGLSLYNLKKYDPALELLEPISNDSASPFMEEAKFYTAQSYISNGAVPKGKIILEEISNNNGFYSGKAKEALRKIK